MAKVIVSYSHKEEVYFLPPGVLLKDLVSDLKLSSEEGRVLKVLASDFNMTVVGGVIYIASVNHDDLMKNDQKYFKSEFTPVTTLNGKSLVFDSNSAVLLSVNYEFYLQKAVSTVFNVHTGTRSGCAYAKPAPINEYEKLESAEFLDLGLSINISNERVAPDALPVTKTSNGSFEIKLTSQHNPEQKFISSFDVQLTQAASAVFERAASVDFNYNCGSDYVNDSSITLRSKVNLSVGYAILGRGIELKKIAL